MEPIACTTTSENAPEWNPSIWIWSQRETRLQSMARSSPLLRSLSGGCWGWRRAGEGGGGGCRDGCTDGGGTMAISKGQRQRRRLRSKEFSRSRQLPHRLLRKWEPLLRSPSATSRAPNAGKGRLGESRASDRIREEISDFFMFTWRCRLEKGQKNRRRTIRKNKKICHKCRQLFASAVVYSTGRKRRGNGRGRKSKEMGEID